MSMNFIIWSMYFLFPRWALFVEILNDTLKKSLDAFVTYMNVLTTALVYRPETYSLEMIVYTLSLSKNLKTDLKGRLILIVICRSCYSCWQIKKGEQALGNCLNVRHYLQICVSFLPSRNTATMVVLSATEAMDKSKKSRDTGTIRLFLGVPWAKRWV